MPCGVVDEACSLLRDARTTKRERLLAKREKACATHWAGGFMRRMAIGARSLLLLIMLGLCTNLLPVRVVAAPSTHRPQTNELYGPALAPVPQSISAPVPVDSPPAPLSEPLPPSLPARAEIQSAPVARFGTLPLTFVPNLGQFSDSQVQFVGHGRGAQLEFTPEEVVLNLPVSALPSADHTPQLQNRHSLGESVGLGKLRIRLEEANSQPIVEGVDLLPGVVHYSIGDLPANWRENVPTYQGLRYRDVYPGIDLLYDGSTGTLKSTYVVAPRVNPSQISWRYLGGIHPHIDTAGNLQVTVPVTVPSAASLNDSATMPADVAALVQSTVNITVTEQAPIAWQDFGDKRHSVEVRFSVEVDGSVRFVLGDYNQTFPLIIDPTLIYGSYLGGTGEDIGNDIAVDASGNMYIAGASLSNGFVTKLNATGSQVVYTRYVGGSDVDVIWV
jgi:hypothetical protein